ncbi:hypothetical protein ACFYXM_17610 [Streptomyces sp. NPDC002476]|uniref:hypothetical protein n=1 Tax=Streptomyces sp. NPDC002476 TaxID=3364648 RepID=UPI003686EE39
MAVPAVVPIAHEPDHRTDTIGHYADGRFLATVTHALPDACGDIAVRPFRLTVDGALFVLVTERHEDGDGQDDRAELLPDGLGFGAPWDGLHDT